MNSICETVTASTMTELRQARDRAVTADLVELRLDGIADLHVAGALEGRSKPVIVTCRPTWEGGAFRGNETERLRILSEAIRLGAEFVDVEWRADRTALPTADRTRLIVSLHDFGGVPADLTATVRAMRAVAGKGAIKIAVTTATQSDCVALRDRVGRGSEQIVIGMGAAGLVTRVCPWLFDSAWTYAGKVAPGQMPVDELIGTYRLRETSAATAIYALIGAPLAHSASPAMLNAAFGAAGIDAIYVPMETRDAAAFLTAAAALGVSGASVTAPLKSGWAERGVDIDDVGRAVGAINTLKRTASGWAGRNFDVDGFLAPFRKRNFNVQGKRAVVLGAGGAARAVAWAMKREGAAVCLSARRSDAAAALAAELVAEAVSWPPGPAEILVNATPVGTWPDADKSPLASFPAADGERSSSSRIVYDLVYNPPETRLLQSARAAGAAIIGGLEMLIAQAELQFSYWTDQPAPAGVMEQAAVAFLRKRNA